MTPAIAGAVRVRLVGRGSVECGRDHALQSGWLVSIMLSITATSTPPPVVRACASGNRILASAYCWRRRCVAALLQGVEIVRLCAEDPSLGSQRADHGRDRTAIIDAHARNAALRDRIVVQVDPGEPVFARDGIERRGRQVAPMLSSTSFCTNRCSPEGGALKPPRLAICCCCCFCCRFCFFSTRLPRRRRGPGSSSSS